MIYQEESGREYHIKTGKNEIGKYVILPGDPKRCAKIAALFDDARLVADHREFTTYTGYLDGEKVSVTSTGIGGPSAAIAMEELVRCGAEVFIRVGTCGGIRTDVKSGDLVIATGGTSGAWYPIGVSIADTLTNVDNNLFVTSEVTNGGVENARLLGTHAANVGFVNSDTAYFATHSEDAFASEPAYELYGLANLYDSVLEIAVLADSGINSIADLAGKRVVVGTPASSASTMGWTVLGTYGLTDKDVKGSELSIAEGVEALKNGDVDCVFIFSAAPNSALTELSVTKDFKLLSIDEEHQKAAIEQHSYFSTATLSADLYTCTSEDTTTLAMPTLLACDSSLSNEAAYQFVKGIYENLDVISTSHAMAAKINLDHAANINLEIHPGALQYYREMGIVD